MKPEGSLKANIVQISLRTSHLATTVLHPKMTNVYSLMLFQTLIQLIRRNSEAETVTVFPESTKLKYGILKP